MDEAGWPNIVVTSTVVVGILAAAAGSLFIAAGIAARMRKSWKESGYRWRWPVGVSEPPLRSSPLPAPVETVPSWLIAAAQADAKELKSALFQEVGELQHGNVSFNLESGHEPSVTVSFRFINASIYTVVFDELQGPLQVEGEEIAGSWKFERFEVGRNRRFLLRLRWIITNDISRDTVKGHLQSGKSVHVNLDAVRLTASAKEDPSIISEMRFPQQWWHPRPPFRPLDVAFEVAPSGKDLLLLARVDNTSDISLRDAQVRLDKSELCGHRQSDGQPSLHDHRVPQILLPWVPEGVSSKTIGPMLKGSCVEVARLPDNSPIAYVPDGHRDESGFSFTTAGCNRLTLTLFASNAPAISRTVDFRIVMGNPRLERIVLEECKCPATTA